MFFTCKNFMFSYFTWKKIAPGNGGGWGAGAPSCLSFSLRPSAMKKFSNFYRLSSDSLPMFHKLSSMGVFAVEVIFFVLLSKFLCFLHVFKFTGFVMHFGLDTLNNRTFSKIWTTLHKTWVVVFWARNFIFKF